MNEAHLDNYTRLLVEALSTGAADPEAEEISARAVHDYLSVRVKDQVLERRGRLSANSRQLVAAQHVDEAITAKQRRHHQFAFWLRSNVADDAGICAASLSS